MYKASIIYCDHLNFECSLTHGPENFLGSESWATIIHLHGAEEEDVRFKICGWRYVRRDWGCLIGMHSCSFQKTSSKWHFDDAIIILMLDIDGDNDDIKLNDDGADVFKCFICSIWMWVREALKNLNDSQYCGDCLIH